jgi:hypothetical protein
MRTLLPVLAVLVIAAPAAADPYRYVRKPGVVVEAPKLSDRVKPKPPKVIKDRPLTGNDVMLIEERNEPLRREQEALLVKLVGQTPDSDLEKPDLLFRLAEHYAKQQRFWRLKSIETVKDD